MHSGKPKLDYALAFDIDGVLMLGSDAIPAGAKALQLLEKRKIPYILLTNGGGKWEHDRVAELSDRLGVNVFFIFKFPPLTIDLGESVYPEPHAVQALCPSISECGHLLKG